MNRSFFLSIGIALVLAIAAVFGTQSYLNSQRAALLNSQVKEEPKGATVVVAAQPLRFGKIIEPASLKVVAWPAGAVPEGAFSSIEELMGDTGEPRYVMSGIEAAEPILSNKITGPGQRATLSAALTPGMKAVSIRVNDVLGVAGFILPGDRVDVMLTREANNGSNGKEVYTDVLMQGLRVLAVDQLADDRSDEPSVVKTATFEVSTAEAQRLVLAQTVGTLSLALRNVASADVEQVDPVRVSDLGGGPSSAALMQAKLLAEQEERLANIERLVRNVDDKSAERLDALRKEIEEDTERKLAEIEQTEDAPMVPILKPAPAPVVPSFSTVGVYRDTERTEYKVNNSAN